MIESDILTEADILIVDDTPANVLALEAVLWQAGARRLRTTTDPHAVFALVAAQEPDLLLLDWHMPGLDGPAILRAWPALLAPGTYLPILVLTADVTDATKLAALAAGAHDFLHKPLDLIEVVLRCRTLLTTRRLHQQLQALNTTLSAQVAERTAALETAHLDILARLARAVEAGDDLTGQHTARVGDLAARLAARLTLSAAEVRLYAQAAPLHDLGKVAIPDTILGKPGPLDQAERAIMETHAMVGAELLVAPAFTPLHLASEIALTHHERWDGRGYPHGLAGEAIPLSGRIVAVADVWDALIHARPYKPAWSWARARAEIAAQGGQQFEPAVVQAFLAEIPPRAPTRRPNRASYPAQGAGGQEWPA